MTLHLSLLMTDGYKFSMAEAGFPLRDEDFYYSHRRGGWQYVPLDIEKHVKALLPKPSPEDYAFLDTHNYFLGAGSRAAFEMADQVKVRAVPKGGWVYDREPVFTVNGVSAISSWLEPTALQINRRIQVATCALLTPHLLPEMVGNATCEREREITMETLDSMDIKAPEIVVDSLGYYTDVFDRARRMVEIVGDPNRLFEVGMRAVSCEEQHEIALKAIRDAGILRTSNVYAARKMGMIPIGTMGHEHIMRFGSSYPAFVAMRDRVPGFLFNLPDTFSTLGEGVPSALQAMAGAPGRDAGIRFDSEHNIESQYVATVCMARERNLDPLYALESGWDDVKTSRFEHLREMLGVPKSRQCYGLGNFFVKPKWKHFGRDTVQAVYKLSKSLVGRQKMGDEPGEGKESLPGDLLLWRPHLGMAGYEGPCGYVSQVGENWKPPVPATLLTGAHLMSTPSIRFTFRDVMDFAQNNRIGSLALSPETQRLRGVCYRERADAIANASLQRSN